MTECEPHPTPFVDVRLQQIRCFDVILLSATVTKYRRKVMKSNAKETILTSLLVNEAAPQRFVEEPVAGDGNCGFNVLGIEREELVNVLLSCSGDLDAREAVVEDIFELAELKQFDPLFQPLLAELIAKGRAAQDVYHQTVADFYYALNYNHKECDFDEMLEVVLASGNEALNECILLQRSLFDKADSDLYDFCCTEDIYRKYIESYRGNLWISRRCAVLYGKYKGISVYIWQHDFNASSQLVLLDFTVSTNKDAPVVHMLWKDGNHFNRLVPKTKPLLNQDAEQKSAQESAENQPAKQKTSQVQAVVEEAKWLSKVEAESALVSFLFGYVGAMEKKENSREYSDQADLFSDSVEMLLYPEGVNQFHRARQRNHYAAVLRALNKDRLHKYQVELALKAADEIDRQFVESYGGKLDVASDEYDPSAAKDELYYQAILDNLNREFVNENQPRLYTSLPRDEKGKFDTRKMVPHEIYLYDNGCYYIKDGEGEVSQHDYTSGTQFKGDPRVFFYDSVFRNRLQGLLIKKGHAKQPGILQSIFYQNEVTQTLLNGDFKGSIPLQVDKEVRHYQFFKEPHTAQTMLLQEDPSFRFSHESILYCPSEPRLAKNTEYDLEMLSSQEIAGHIRRLVKGSVHQRTPDVIRKQLGRSIFRYLNSLKCYEPGEVIALYRDQKEAVTSFFSDARVIFPVLHAFAIFRGMLTGDRGVDTNKLRLLLNDKIIVFKLNDYALLSKNHKGGLGVIDSLVKAVSSGNDAKSDLKSIIDYFEDEGSSLCSNVGVIENFLQEVQDGANKKSVNDTHAEEAEEDADEKSIDDLLLEKDDIVLEKFNNSANKKWVDGIWLDKNLLSAFKKAMEFEFLPTIYDVETPCWYEEREEINGLFFGEDQEEINTKEKISRTALLSYCEANKIPLNEFETIGDITPRDFSEFGRVWRLSPIDEQWIEKQKKSNALSVVERSGHYYRLVPKENQLSVFVALFSKQGMEKTKKTLLDVFRMSDPEYDTGFSYYAFVRHRIASVKKNLMKELHSICDSIEQNEKNLNLRSRDVAQIIAHDRALSSRKGQLDRLSNDSPGNDKLVFLFDFLVDRLNSDNPFKVRCDNLNDPAKATLELAITDEVRKTFLRQIMEYGFTIDSIKTGVSRTLLFEALKKNLQVKVLTRLLALHPDPFVKDASGKSPIHWLREEVIKLKTKGENAEQGENADEGKNAEELEESIEKFNLLLEYVVKRLGGRLDTHSKLIEGLEDIQRLDQYAQHYITYVESYLPKHRLDLIKPRRLLFSRVYNRGELLVSVLETLWERLGERQYGHIIDELQKTTDEAELGFFRIIGSQLLRSTHSFIARGMKVVASRSYKRDIELYNYRKSEMLMRGEIHDINTKVESVVQEQKSKAAQQDEATDARDRALKEMKSKAVAAEEKIATQEKETAALKAKTVAQEKETAELKAKMAALEARMMELFKTDLPHETGAKASSLPSTASTEKKPAIVQGGARLEVLETNTTGGHSSRFFATVPDPLSEGSECEDYTNVYDEAGAREVFPLDL